jgi:hypothetical protein
MAMVDAEPKFVEGDPALIYVSAVSGVSAADSAGSNRAPARSRNETGLTSDVVFMMIFLSYGWLLIIASKGPAIG